MKNKIASMEQIMEKIHDGQTIMFSDAHGGQAADEIIDAMLKLILRSLRLRSTPHK